MRSKTKLVFIGDAPYLSTLQRLCTQLRTPVILTSIPRPLLLHLLAIFVFF
jgi:hypothetical protein